MTQVEELEYEEAHKRVRAWFREQVLMGLEKPAIPVRKPSKQPPIGVRRRVTFPKILAFFLVAGFLWCFVYALFSIPN